MKLKLTIDNKPKHSDVVTSVAWSTADTVFSLGDDHKLIMWNLSKNENTSVAEIPQEIFPTSMQWPPKNNSGQGGTSRKSTDLLLVTATDGNYYLLGRGGRIEKTVQGHKGAVLCGQWNWDGSEILTSGEDGCVRIWSRAGMLRSTLAQSPEPVYGCAWNPEGQAVLYSVGHNLIIKPTISQAKITQWKGHEGVILSVGWSPTSKLIVSGGEDCRYKVWDPQGKLMYSSALHTHPITAVAWAPAGDLFSVGSFNILRVCDRFGWSHCMEKLKTGSIYNMNWSADGTQFACASASGHVFLASVIGRSVSYGTFEAVLTARRTVVVTEFTEKAEDRLDFRDRVLKMSMDYGYLICTTTTQLYIYKVNNVNTPTVTDLRDNTAISLILQSPSNFILCGAIHVSVWNYEGKQIATVKWGGMRSEFMNKENSSLASDILAFIDHSDSKTVRIFDPATGKPLPEIKMRADIRQIALSKENYPGDNDKQLAILDANLDLFTVIVQRFGSPVEPKRLTTGVTSMLWHSEAPMMAVIREGRLRFYYFPQIVYIDGALLDYTWEDRDLTDLGKQPQLLSYESNRVSIRKPDGVLIAGTASPFMVHLHSHAMLGKFSEARRICRYVNNKLVWGVMAGLSSWKQDLSLAEICYSELELYDKVLFIQDIKMNSNDEPTRKALMAILSGNIVEAENILLQNNRFGHAVELNVNCCRWDRAMELSLKHGILMDLVLKTRKRYLDNIDKKETKPLFLGMEKKIPSQLPDSKKPTKATTKKKKKSSAGQERTMDQTDFSHFQARSEAEELPLQKPVPDLPSFSQEVEEPEEPEQSLPTFKRRPSRNEDGLDIDLDRGIRELDLDGFY